MPLVRRWFFYTVGTVAYRMAMSALKRRVFRLR